jgi:hypothetical protein
MILDLSRPSIRQQVSDELAVLIPPGKWETYFDELDRNGKLNGRPRLTMLRLALEAIEKLELEVEDMSKRVSLLESDAAKARKGK